jgi:hypothetical protein
MNALSDVEMYDLARRMNVDLVFCSFKSNLAEETLQYNKSYVVNLENKIDEDGIPNTGSHYTCFQVNKDKHGKIQGVYFDSYGAGPPQAVDEFVGFKLPYSNKDIQSLMSSACGFFCLAFLHFINASQFRTGDLYVDCSQFTDMFDDLNVSMEHKKNEYILKHFFRSSDEEERKKKPIEV